MGKEKILQGMKFGRLTVIKLYDTVTYHYKNSGTHKVQIWECLCECGNTVNVRDRHLLTGHTKSCGCFRKETTSKMTKTDGRTTDRLYRVWGGMLSRCYREYTNGYKNYGGRGIKVCKEWHDYPTFKQWAYSNGYDPNAKYGDCTLDRIDVNGNYEPNNCRWVSMAEQRKNKRKRG